MYLILFDEVTGRQTTVQRVLLGDPARWIINLNDEHPKFERLDNWVGGQE